MQDANQTPSPDPHSDTTEDPALNEPGVDAMGPAAGNPSSDAGGDPAGSMADGNTTKTEDEDEKAQ
jgi:hypothetical protein